MAATGSSNSAWLTTSELCAALAISRSKLCRMKQRKVLRQGLHWVRKNPTAARSDQLWSLEGCRSLLAKQRLHG
jgi:hypothetical protein